MDGDVAPLQDIAELAGMYDARMMVDEAHATGNLGPDGRGAVAEAALESEVDVIVGTLGKALGSYGAYVCASAEMVRYLINTARPLIYSTAPSPPAVAGALAALNLLRERPHRVERLRANARALRRGLAGEGFPVADADMHIVPLIVEDERAAMRLCQEALERGVFAQAIRPPSVRAGTSRLRLTAMASHTASELEMAATVFADAARAIGLDPASITPALPERQTSIEELDEREPAYAERGHGELRYTELTVVTHEHARIDSESSGPFDLERDADATAARTAASRSSGATHDQPTEEFNVELDLQTDDRAAEASERDAPLTSSANCTASARRSRHPPAGLSTMRGMFVTATDTGVGKTVLSAALLAAMTSAGEPARAFKPVVTGLRTSRKSRRAVSGRPITSCWLRAPG